MKICFDTNVVLDVLLRREPFTKDAAAMMSLVESTLHTGLLCATTVTTLHHLTRGPLGETGARHAIADCLQLMELAHVSRPVLDAAIQAPMSDFEDAVLAHAAHQAGAHAIVTRNLRDFALSPVRAYTPDQFLALQAL